MQVLYVCSYAVMHLYKILKTKVSRDFPFTVRVNYRGNNNILQSRKDETLIQKQAISAKRNSEAYKENMKNYFPEKFCHGATPTLHEFSKRFKNTRTQEETTS